MDLLCLLSRYDGFGISGRRVQGLEFGAWVVGVNIANCTLNATHTLNAEILNPKTR